MDNKNKLPREAIAMRVTKELHNGNVVNLGIGIPTLCPQFIDPKKFIMYHSEVEYLIMEKWRQKEKKIQI